MRGNWKKDTENCSFTRPDSDFVTCNCNHLTLFGVLVVYSSMNIFVRWCFHALNCSFRTLNLLNVKPDRKRMIIEMIAMVSKLQFSRTILKL